jgi:hypothetical protein
MIWAQITSPSGPKTIAPSGPPFTLASSLMTAYSIHDFLMHNIIKNPNRQDYTKIVGITYLIGTAAYTFIAYGAYAIVNRVPVKSHP